MLVKVSNQLVGDNSKSYVDLFSGLKGIKDGGYKTYKGEEVILPDGFKLNTLVLQVEDEENKPQEVVVDYLGNELVVSDEQRVDYSPGLLKHLEMIGCAMFSPDSQGNLVINSTDARAFTQSSFIENSNLAKVENSGGAKVENSYRATVENSGGAKVENSYRATVENSDGATVENSDGAKVIDGVVQEPASV